MLPTGPLRSGGEVVDGSDDRPEASSAIVAQDLDTMDPRGRGDSESLTTSSACTVCSVSLTVGGTLQVAIAYLVSIREVRLWDRPSGEIGVSCSHTGIQDEDADPSTLVAAAAASANTVQAPAGAVLVGLSKLNRAMGGLNDRRQLSLSTQDVQKWHLAARPLATFLVCRADLADHVLLSGFHENDPLCLLRLLQGAHSVVVVHRHS